MTKIQFDTPITDDGDFAFPAREGGREYLVELSGAFGGGTATIGFLSASGNIVAFDDAGGTTDGAWIVTLPSSGILVVTLATSTDPSLLFKATVLP